MNLDQLSDSDLHLHTKLLVSRERHLVTKVLHHLKEIERRRFFSDFGCSSLFDYAVKMLGYSEGQAQRRIQAMRLMKEIPEIEKKIADGSLSLSNIAQAQTAFNEIKRQNNHLPVDDATKKEVLSQLENKSSREGQRELLRILPQAGVPKERERLIDVNRTEVKFLMDDDLRQKLEEIRSLLGPKGAMLSFAELFSHMAEISLNQLKSKVFGKKRAMTTHAPEVNAGKACQSNVASTSTVKAKPAAQAKPAEEPQEAEPPRSETVPAVYGHYIPAKIKHVVWLRDRGQCRQCGSRRSLNYDHIVPVAKHGQTAPDNLRLLCFQCNQRAAIKLFGLDFMLKKSGMSEQKIFHSSMQKSFGGLAKL